MIYGALGKLRKSEITGTPAQTIAETGLPFVQGGTWNQNGVILWRGTAAAWSRCGERRDACAGYRARAGRDCASMAAVPAGRTTVYLFEGCRFAGLDRSMRRVAGRKTRSPEQEDAAADEPSGMVGHVGADGVCISRPPARGHAAHSHSTSKRRLLVELEGAIASGVGSFAGATAGLWSVARNGALTYRSGGAGLPLLTWRDLNGKVLGTVGEPGLYGVPSVSPDGTRVAYRLGDAQGNLDIYVRDLSRGMPVKLTFSPGVDDAPVWSHDSKTIYFASVRDGRRDLYEKNADGSGEDRLLYKSEHAKTPFSVSRDGKFLLFGSADPKTQLDLWLLPLQGERKPFVFVNSPATEALGQISNDGKWIVYVARRRPGRTHGPAVSAGTTSGTTDGSKWLVAGNAIQPRWSPNGKQLFYLTVTGDLIAVDVEAGSAWKPADPKRLFGGLAPGAWSWHPDGMNTRDADARRRRPTTSVYAGLELVAEAGTVVTASRSIPRTARRTLPDLERSLESAVAGTRLIVVAADAAANVELAVGRASQRDDAEVQFRTAVVAWMRIGDDLRAPRYRH